MKLASLKGIFGSMTLFSPISKVHLWNVPKILHTLQQLCKNLDLSVADLSVVVYPVLKFPRQVRKVVADYFVYLHSFPSLQPVFFLYDAAVPEFILNLLHKTFLFLK